ncbi:hypothetical protein OAP63_09660 [Vibrio sp.]|uniref:Uncharacterized protein n=1 Tax=Vibrio viridaestus TaxID=2487322 RepID=A0A3N9TDG5_9VIBR|nr:hypothetical protein [Vibrio viridaestus]MDC0610993.1 hypothetical protein [Vibrio sp.]RQW62100.1 hypothetical protein EES38_15385 [Vibrio viridaestus]
MQDILTLGGINEEQIAEIGQWIERNHCESETDLSPLREEFPNLVFTLCSEDDLGFHEPFRTFSFFDLHLAAHSVSGCSSLTQYVEGCSGLVIALHEE